MDSDDSPRRFTSDEVRRILEAATQPEPAGASPPTSLEGFTLAEIQEIAEEVGIDPDRVQRASLALVHRVPLETNVSLGTYQRERRLQRLLSPEDMWFVAQEADRYFKVEGQVRQTHGYLEWHSTEARAFVGLVNESGTTRVRAILDRAPRFFLGGGAIGAVAGFSMLRLVSEVGGVAGAVGAAVVAVVAAGAVTGFWRWSRASTIRRIEDLLTLMTEGPVSLGSTDDLRR